MTATAAAVPIVGADVLRATLDFRDLIEPVSRAFQDSSAGRGANGLLVLRPGEDTERGDVYVKTGVLRGHDIFAVKVAPWFALNVERGQPQGGFIGVFDAATGHTRAILDEQHYLSDIRTAAAGALAARVLAPAIVRSAAVLGAGVQAYWQALALHGERAFTRLLIWARDSQKAAALADRLARELPRVAFEIADSAEVAVRAADVVITATGARAPIVDGAWLRPGQHITSVGADDATKCELDAECLRRARVFVDDRETAASLGNIHRAIAGGGYAAGDVAGEIGEVLDGSVMGRQQDGDITIASFIGIGAQDVAAAETVVAKLGL